MAELTDWIIAFSSVVLFIATCILAWYTAVLGKHAKRLNEMENDRIEKEKAEKRKMDLETVISLGHQIQVQINPSVYAEKARARTKANTVAYIQPVQKLFGFKYMLSPENALVLTMLMKGIIWNAHNSIQDSGFLPQKEALEKEIHQLKDKVMEEVGKWQAQYEQMASHSP